MKSSSCFSVLADLRVVHTLAARAATLDLSGPGLSFRVVLTAAAAPGAQLHLALRRTSDGGLVGEHRAVLDPDGRIDWVRPRYFPSRAHCFISAMFFCTSGLALRPR